jgi:hypothetical protein
MSEVLAHCYVWRELEPTPQEPILAREAVRRRGGEVRRESEWNNEGNPEIAANSATTGQQMVKAAGEVATRVCYSFLD